MSELFRMKSVGAILCNAQGRILLQLRDDKPDLLYPNHWTTLGGMVEDGEDPEEAMRRELIEEIELELSLMLWKVFEHSRQVGNVWVTIEQYMYVGEIHQAECDIVLNEGQALGYFGADDIVNIPIAFGFETTFKEFFEQRQGNA